ncbi:M23 family metallopeptidase [Acidithiobacillus caldus]|uniref:M23 family metallopeptidase n=1 Tax=Acidithiobacillus caldus TaxID=33059 RepID=UPI001C07DA5D|nr:M23 family metallopeptidase [Acidithiobacillus caldus]MBU2801560.1 M23 family metallopeptidase [Acidithiobacillus caldus]
MIAATVTIFGGGAIFFLNKDAFDYDKLRYTNQASPFANGRGDPLADNYYEAIGYGNESLDDYIYLNEKTDVLLKQHGASLSDFEAALDKPATGLKCTGKENDNSYAAVEKVYSGTVNKSTFSPVYHCQMPTQFRSNGTRMADYDRSDVRVGRGFEEEELQVDADRLNTLCPREEFEKAKGSHWFHCRDYRNVYSPKDPNEHVDAMSSPYGPRSVTNSPNKVHQGVDIPMGIGSKVLAAYDGIVVHSDFWNGSGDRTYGTVVLEHRLADGRLAYTEYTHLDISKVTYGQVVHAGEVIGQSGARGKEGPRHYPAHLHYAEWLGAVGGGNKSTGMPQFTKWEGHEEGKPVNRGHPVNYAVSINPDRGCIQAAVVIPLPKAEPKGVPEAPKSEVKI